jgi:CheY-like chemotaxis protein
MDIQLSDSELNGIEIVRFLRGDTTMKPPEGAAGFVLRPLPPIIFVTAYAARYTKEELVRIGADDVVTKPLDLAKLHLAITRAIASSATAALNRASQSRRATEPASSSNTSGAASRAAELPLGATQNGTAKPR